MDTDKTIELKNPVEVNGAMITAVTMRKPKVRDMVASQIDGQSSAQNEVNLVAKLIGINPEDLLELDGVDYLKLQGALKDFLS